MKPIGIIKTPFTKIENMPIQPKGAKDIEGKIIVDEIYKDGLKDLEGFSHIYLIYHFHKADKVKLIVKPFLDTNERGVFSTRSPLRPNHIGISIVELIKIEGNELFIKGADILDHTPLFDIKPYIEKFDHPEQSRSGWMKSDIDEIADKRSDNRFK
jgi:tRNA-Thr(GGU) m(6)t(6)A37 methyltransferase TsaA